MDFSYIFLCRCCDDWMLQQLYILQNIELVWVEEKKYINWDSFPHILIKYFILLWCEKILHTTPGFYHQIKYHLYNNSINDSLKQLQSKSMWIIYQTKDYLLKGSDLKNHYFHQIKHNRRILSFHIHTIILQHHIPQIIHLTSSSTWTHKYINLPPKNPLAKCENLLNTTNTQHNKTMAYKLNEVWAWYHLFLMTLNHIENFSS